MHNPWKFIKPGINKLPVTIQIPVMFANGTVVLHYCKVIFIMSCYIIVHSLISAC